ncbi:hypothetical protein KIN20_003641 [Parelaphostrongylus tenuis]|uniref:Uncharacterized protein n=1 Tax=Parelaphostrongylus tenuis TaxID=148309 RepID=A0AAD5MFZ7_PARTN|nr:hypothetical protein KIN20_003641 [Parelaphostrongylus tenuis]
MAPGHHYCRGWMGFRNIGTRPTYHSNIRDIEVQRAPCGLSGVQYLQRLKLAIHRQLNQKEQSNDKVHVSDAFASGSHFWMGGYGTRPRHSIRPPQKSRMTIARTLDVDPFHSTTLECGPTYLSATRCYLPPLDHALPPSHS